MKEILINLFVGENFVPHGHCYLWNPGLVWLHILSDSLTALAYYSIPLMLAYFVQKRQDLPFKGIFLLFATFIVSCGTTHLMEIWTLWHPVYWLSGSLKAVTAIVSLYTASELFPLIPKILALPSSTQLEATNRKLAQEVIERQQVETALKQSEARFRSIFEGASIGIEIIDLTGRTIAMNPALQLLLGYNEEEFQKFSFTEYTPPQDAKSDGEANSDSQKKRYLVGDRRASPECDRYQMEKRYLCKNGQLIWCHVHTYLVRDAFGQPQFRIRMVEDVTDRKQALIQLQQYQERLEDMVGERTALLTQVNEQLSWEANHDALTGLINRREFQKRLEQSLVTARNQNQQHVLCYLDLDKFKIVNDTCGHAAGDELLRQVSSLLQAQVRQTDLLARLGGDEFGLLLYNCPIRQGQAVVQSLQESIREYRFEWEGKPFTIGVSIGLVGINGESGNLERVMNAADAACYQAKNSGRNCIYVYKTDETEQTQKSQERQWVTRINQAIASPRTPKLANNQFCLYSQQIFPLNSHPSGKEYHEVLLRLIDEEGEIIPPMAFLPAAERYNLMPTIDRWVIDTVFGILKQQSRETQNGCLYGINLSLPSIKDERLIDFLKKRLTSYQIQPQAICFEISETVAIANLSQVIKLIEALKSLGYRFAIDDFGSGISSLSYLKQLPVDYLKINGNFIQQVVDDPIAYEMVKMINQIGHLVGIKTIAKCVTDESILSKVRAIGVDYAQGYGIALPRPLIANSTLIYENIRVEERKGA